MVYVVSLWGYVMALLYLAIAMCLASTTVNMTFCVDRTDILMYFDFFHPVVYIQYIFKYT
jgi:hypothetical protein